MVVTDVPGKAISPIFKSEAVLEEGTDRLSRNVGNYNSMLRNILEERRPHSECIYIYIEVYNIKRRFHLYRCGSLKLRTVDFN
jgi:hypothetical protein